MIAFLIEYDWLGHIAEAFAMATIVFLLFLPLQPIRVAIIAGAMFAVGHFHGREKRDYEVSVHAPPPQLDAYQIWLWSYDQLSDFLPVLAVGAAVCATVWWFSD